MGNINYTCPKCGNAFQAEESLRSINCPNCGVALTLTPNTNNQTKSLPFTTESGQTVATAVIPQDYERKATYERVWQSEMVPHFYRISATAPSHGIYMNSYSKELTHDVRSSTLKGMMKLVSEHTKNGYGSFIDPNLYLQKEAEREAGGPLKLVATAPLPSYYARNPSAAQSVLQNDIRNYALYVGTQPRVPRAFCQSYLYRYEGKMNGRDLIVLAGMDYEAAELDFTLTPLDGIGDAVGKLFSKKKTNSDGTVPFGNGDSVDDVMAGPVRSYFCMYYQEYEKEALPVFMNFVSSIVPDPSISQMEVNILNNKLSALQAEAAANQAILAQKQMQLQQNQAQLRQTLANNSAAMSNMIMDSWNQKMASDSRISAARSEAIMGVNTYTNSYGQNVDVSVVADHVYQNQYGDVYGVSGNAPDQSVLNDLQWTELNKK